MVRKSDTKAKSRVTSKHSNKSKIITKHKSSSREDNFKQDLLTVDNDQEKYNKLFEQKLSEQYKEFRNIKEHSAQSKKFVQIIVVVIVIVLMAFLLISFG